MALQTGTHPSLMENTSRSRVARTKLGTAVNKVEKKTMILSGSLLRMMAAKDPRIIPRVRAKNIAVKPSLADIGKDSAIMVLISLPFLRDTPKSP